MNWWKEVKNGLSNGPRGDQGVVISLLNQKGGVGKTTLTYCLAHALANQNKKVLCIDCDPQSNLTQLFSAQAPDPGKTLFPLLLNGVAELKHLHSVVSLDQCLIKSGPLTLLPANESLSGLELTVAGITSPRQILLKKFLKQSGLKDCYDYILIDGPPTLGLLVVNILCACDGVLIPFRPDSFSHKGLELFHQTLRQVDDMGLGAAPKVLGYIPNMVEPRRKQSAQLLQQIQRELKDSAPSPRIFSPIANRVQLEQASTHQLGPYHFKGQKYQALQSSFTEMAQHIRESFQ